MDIIRDRIDLVQKLAQSVERQLQRQLDQHVLGPMGLNASVGQFALAVGVSTTVAYSVARYIVYNLYFHPTSKIPGPPVDRWIPFGGNMREIFRDESGVPHKRWTKKYGGVLLYHGPWNNPRVLVTDPAVLKEILTTHVYDYVKTPETVNFLKRTLGEGLLLAEGEVHRHQRKMLNPAFSVQTIRELTPLMAIPAVHLCEKWHKEIEGKEEPSEVIVSHGLSLATLDVIGLAGFGQDFSSVKYDGTEKSNKLSSAYLAIFDPDRGFGLMQFLSFFFPLLRKVPTKKNLELAQAIRWLDEESEAVVLRGMDNAKQMKHNSVLGLMIKSSEEQGMSPSVKDLQNQCLTFLAAGHETTSTSLSWCLWLLAQHQDIQDALRDEVKPLFENLDVSHDIFTKDPLDHSNISTANIPTYDAINSIKLLDNVCRETMRVLPPVPVTNRISTKDGVLGGYFVPKGTPIFLSLISNLHSKAIWGEDAEEFRPSRWDEETASRVSPYEYAPFLAGNRQCIGNRFAMIEMKILLAILITKFQFFEKPGFTPKKRQTITLRPAPNMPLLLKPL